MRTRGPGAVFPGPVALPAQVPAKIGSPDGRIEFSVRVSSSAPDAGRLTDAVSRRSTPMVVPSRLGLKLEGRALRGEKVLVLEATPASGADADRLPHGRAGGVEHPRRGARIRVESNGGPLELEIRAYKDGVAFRYDLPAALRAFAL